MPANRLTLGDENTSSICIPLSQNNFSDPHAVGCWNGWLPRRTVAWFIYFWGCHMKLNIYIYIPFTGRWSFESSTLQHQPWHSHCSDGQHTDTVHKVILQMVGYIHVLHFPKLLCLPAICIIIRGWCDHLKNVTINTNPHLITIWKPNIYFV